MFVCFFVFLLKQNSEFNDTESYNGYRPINNSQRRLHSISSYSNERQLSTNSHHTLNGHFIERSLNDEHEKNFNEQNFDMTIKTNDNEQINQPHLTGFDRLEQDFVKFLFVFFYFLFILFINLIFSLL